MLLRPYIIAAMKRLNRHLWGSNPRRPALWHRISCERGQAGTEYVLAVCVGLAAVVALAGIVSFFTGSSEELAAHSTKTFARAPYSLPAPGLVSEQWAKDILFH